MTEVIVQVDLSLLDLPWWSHLLITLVVTHLTIISVTLYLHRHQAHRAIELHAFISHFFRFWLWLTTGMVTWQWVAIHRKHHAKVETKDDPHSPQIHGLKYFFKLMLPPALTGGVKLYRDATVEPNDLDQYRHGTPDDWVERNIYTPFSFAGVFLLLAINVVLFGAVGIAMWLVEIFWIPFWAAGVINGVGHYSGYRNYETPDASRNIVPWGIIVGGEELHNNHHAYASSAKFSARPYEIDIGWFYIKVLELLGLASIKKVAPKIQTTSVKDFCDIDTLKTLLNNRIQVMSNFTREVLKTVCHEESSKIKTAQPTEFKLFRKAHLLMRKEISSLDETARTKLESILGKNRNLQFVYQMKTKLQEICLSRNEVNHQSSLSALQEWCKHAEESGIAALEEFSLRLKRYSVS